MTQAEAKILVDILVVFHLGFVLFVILGGLLALKWPILRWIHLPALCWGILVELNGWLCPLTPLENHLREAAGLGLYQGDFVMHYLMPILYPVDLTRHIQIVFGLSILLINGFVYARLFRRR